MLWEHGMYIPLALILLERVDIQKKSTYDGKDIVYGALVCEP